MPERKTNFSLASAALGVLCYSPAEPWLMHADAHLLSTIHRPHVCRLSCVLGASRTISFTHSCSRLSRPDSCSQEQAASLCVPPPWSLHFPPFSEPQALPRAPLTQPPPPESPPALSAQPSANGEPETKGASLGSHSTTPGPAGHPGWGSSLRDSCRAPLSPTAPRSRALGTCFAVFVSFPSQHSV